MTSFYYKQLQEMRVTHLEQALLSANTDTTDPSSFYGRTINGDLEAVRPAQVCCCASCDVVCEFYRQDRTFGLK